MSLLTAEQLGEVLERTRRDLFRIETLPSYDTAMTTGDFRRWLAGETEPTWEVRQPWLDTLTQWARDGRPRRRMHYHPDGQLRGAEVLDAQHRGPHRIAADVAWRPQSRSPPGGTGTRSITASQAMRPDERTRA
jgi:hypothetical protein